MKNHWARLGGVLGIVYCIAGFVLIFLGWNGAASHDRVESQLPYVVSGGIAGLALVAVGAALIVAYSLRTDRVELKASIDALRDRALASAPAAGAGANPAGASAAAVLAGAESYHRPSCTLVAGQQGATRMTAAEAAAAGLEPCRICRPDQLVA
jgi:hypothetical protein